jgi:N-acetyl-gamma-glutamylphosphate reductase
MSFARSGSSLMLILQVRRVDVFDASGDLRVNQARDLSKYRKWTTARLTTGKDTVHGLKCLMTLR